MDERKAKMIARLEQRNKKMTESEQSNESMQAAGSAGRDATALEFEAKFAELSEKVRQEIDQQTASTSDDSQSATGTSSPVQLINDDINGLEKMLTDYIHALPQYDARKAQIAIQEFQKQHRSLIDQQKSRKAFSFARKPKTQQEAQAKSSGDSLACNGASGDAKQKQQPQKKTFAFLMEDAASSIDRCDQQNTDVTIDAQEAAGKDVNVKRMEKCRIVLKAAANTVHFTSLHSCVVLLRPVRTSVFIDSAVDCTFVVACQQLRMHSSSNCTLYLHTTSSGIIEHCTGIKLSPYPLLPATSSFFTDASLNAEKNQWRDLKDFNWLADDKPSPNWTVLEEGQREQFCIE